MIKTTNHSKTLIYSNKALSLAYRIHSDEALSKAFLLRGISYFKYENESSYFYYSEALKTADRSGLMKIKPDLYYALAMFYRDANDNKMAAVYLDSSIYSARSIRDYHTIFTTFFNREILRLLIKGLNHKEIGKEVSLSRTKVENILKEMRDHFHVKTNLELIKILSKADII